MIKYFIYRLKWHLAYYFNFKYPVHIDLELTNLCNQKCLSCWHYDNKNLPFRLNSMSLTLAEYYLRQARNLGTLSVKFNLRGESSLHNKLPYAIKYAKNIGYIDTILNTNLQVSISKLDGILKAGLDTLIISVDSFDVDNYCAIHNCDISHFLRLKSNLLYLDLMKKKHKIKTKIIFNFHINKINEDEDIESYRNKYPHVKFRIKNTQKRLGKDISLDNKKRKRKKNCPHMKRRLTIQCSGKIYPCCVSYSEPEDILLERNGRFLDEIWNGFKREMMLKTYRKGIYMKSCDNCTSGEIWK